MSARAKDKKGKTPTLAGVNLSEFEEALRSLRLLSLAVTGVAVDMGGFGVGFESDPADVRRNAEIVAVDLMGTTQRFGDIFAAAHETRKTVPA